MWLFNSKKSSGTQQSESEKMNELSQPIADVQQSSEEEMNSLIQQLQEEKSNNTELRQIIEELKIKIEEKEKQLKTLSAQSVSTDNRPNKDSKESQQPVVASTIEKNQEKMMQQMATMSEKLDLRIKELIDDRTNLSMRLEEKASRFEDLAGRVQEDRYRKDKVKILRRNINLRNLISHVVEDYREEKPQKDGYETPAANFLEQQLEEIIKAIDADLQQEMLTPLVNGVEGSDFDAEYQEIVERQPTERPELDGKVYRSVSPGYVWTLPYIFKPRINETGEEIHTYKFLLRSEDVITYKYEMKEQKK